MSLQRGSSKLVASSTTDVASLQETLEVIMKGRGTRDLSEILEAPSMFVHVSLCTQHVRVCILMYTCHTYICEIGQPTSRYTHPDEHVIRTYARSCHHHRGVYIKVNTQFCSLLFVRIRFTLPRGCRLRLHVEECAEGTYHGLALRRRDRLRPEGHGLCSSPYLVHLLTLDTPYTTLHYTILHLMLHYTTLHYTFF